MQNKKLLKWLSILPLFLMSATYAQYGGTSNIPVKIKLPSVFGRPVSNQPVYYPDGTVRYPDGTVHYPDGGIRYPDGTIKYPDGTVRYPDGRMQYPANRYPEYQHDRNVCDMPPGQAKKIYGDKSARKYAHMKKGCNCHCHDGDDDDRRVYRKYPQYPDYPQSYPQYPQYPQYPGTPPVKGKRSTNPKL